MKLKLPAMILLMLGFVSFVFGARDLKEQWSFAIDAEAVSGTIIAIKSGGRYGNGSPDIVASYVYDGITQTDRVHLPLFANALGLLEGEKITLRVSTDPNEQPQLVRDTVDAGLYYVAGTFYALLGLMFAMIGLLIQKFGKA